jgi:hypothetical protein
VYERHKQVPSDWARVEVVVKGKAELPLAKDPSVEPSLNLDNNQS